jgi:hypothetical protein
MPNRPRLSRQINPFFCDRRCGFVYCRSKIRHYPTDSCSDVDSSHGGEWGRILQMDGRERRRTEFKAIYLMDYSHNSPKLKPNNFIQDGDE